MEDTQAKHRAWLVCIALAAAITAVYSPLYHAGFVAYDDPEYIITNDMVQKGFTWPGIIWAFDGFHASNWHPLTWISYMADVELFGPGAAGHHAANVVLHAANAMLLFQLLRRLTADFWRSALAAAFFALHPMHVESVAWVSERKDVLSTLFGLLSLLAHVRSAQEPGRKIFPALSILWYGLGLLAKPMLVTLPFVMLLLDYWPLRRSGKFSRLVLDKLPYFGLAAVSCAVTVLAQRSGGALSSLVRVPLVSRLENTPVAYVRYIIKTFWPCRLAVLYPYVYQWQVWQIAGATIVLLAVTGRVWRHRRSHPWCLVGWFWFLGMLLPVIGLVQVGSAAMADRYTYLAGTGLLIMVLWSGRMKVAAGLALAACMVLSFIQAGYWKDSETLFHHTLAVTGNNSIIENDLGKVLLIDGRTDEALVHLRRAVDIDPSYAIAHYNLGQAFLAKGEVAEALAQFDRQTTLAPNDAIAQSTFGVVLLDHGLAKDALPHLEKALEINPHYYEAALSLAWLLATSPDAALRNGARAVQLAELADQLSGGRNAEARGVLAAAYAEARNFTKAEAIARDALQLAGPDSNSDLAVLLRKQLALYHAGLPFRDVQKQ